MNKAELERMIISECGFAQLREHAQMIFSKYGREHHGDEPIELLHETELAREAPADKFDSFEQPCGFVIEALTASQIVKDPLDPLSSLAKLVEQCRENPTVANQVAVVHAMNAISSAGPLAGKGAEQVDAAIRMLGEIKKSDGDNVWGRFFQHNGFGGWSLFYSLPQPWVYWRITNLAGGFNDRISSLMAGANAQDRGHAIIFQHDRFIGRYALFDGNPGGVNNVSAVGGFMNDRTSSILLVRRFNREREVQFPLGSVGFEERIAELLRGVRRLRARGSPIFTWDMWPRFAPTRRFVWIRVPVRVDVPNWFDYDAEIRLWIEFWVDGAGALHAWVAFYGCWVEGGIKSSSIANAIMSGLAGQVGGINAQLTSAIGSLSSALGPLRRQYFLPGTAAASGHTNDDVTLVLERA